MASVIRSSAPGLALVAAFLDDVRPIVAQSADGSGCAVAGVATEADQGTPEALAAQLALRSWHEVLTTGLTTLGMNPQSAQDTATLLLTTLEGAHVLCRAEGTIEPFDAAARALLERIPMEVAATG